MAIDGEVVQIIRRLRDMSLGELAREAGISESYLRDIEAGTRRLKSPRNRERVLTIAAALGIPARAITVDD